MATVTPEFAPGIPAGRVVKKLPTKTKPETWEFGVQRHQAERAGEHFDLRLGDPATGQAHSWSLRHLPKPGEQRLAVQQPTHTVPYMDFKGQIASGYGRGAVEVARRDKAEVLGADESQIRFNIYPGKNIEEYALRRGKEGGSTWFLHNVTTSREAGPGRLLPSSKPAYRSVQPEKLDVSKPETELQAKIDGAHVLYQFKQPGQIPRIVSWRPAERATGVIEHTHKLPGFHRLRTPSGLRDTIVRGELYAAGKDGQALPAARVGGILNAGVWKSRQKQKIEGRLVPVAFDIVRYKGKDVENEPYSVKKKLLDSVRKLAPWLKAPRTAVTASEKEKLIFDIMHGLEPSTEEGVIEWHRDKSVPTKAKFLEERDAYVKGVFAEKGPKRAGTMAGGMEISLTQGGPTVGRVGTGFSHAMKKDMLENPGKYIGLRARIKAPKAPAHYAPQKAVFHSFHLDQDLPEGIKTAAATATLRRREDGGISIEKLSVPQEERGKGKARKLISYIRDKYKGASIHIRPRPFGDMPASIDQLKSFYESEGFKTVDGRDNMVLEKRAYRLADVEQAGIKEYGAQYGNLLNRIRREQGRAWYAKNPVHIKGKPMPMPASFRPQEKPLTGAELQTALAGLKLAQAPRGVYKGQPASPDSVKKLVDFQGITIRVDRPRGFRMMGKDKKGNAWVRRYRYDYGYIPRTKGGDGEGLDVFIGPNKKAPEAFWAVQVKSDGKFDEYKVFLGFPDRDAAIAAYRQHIPKKLMRGMVTMRLEMMKAMLNVDSNGLIKKTASVPRMVGFHDELKKIAKFVIPYADMEIPTEGHVSTALKGMHGLTREGMRKKLVQAAEELGKWTPGKPVI